jgi:putative glutamate/gamma-aminobutyrate antiporter
MASTSTSPSTSSGKGAVAKPSKKAVIGMWAMTILVVTNIVSMRGLASQAEYGYSSIFYYVFAALVFLVPYSLVCAELASTWTKSGGLFRWCAEALGPKWGWAAMYYEWQMVVIWFPAVLMFGAVTLAYIFWPTSFDAKLSTNVIYTLIVVLAVYWVSTLNTFRGMGYANKLSTLGGLFGTIIPAAVLIVMGIVYVCMGNHIFIDAHQSFWPDFSKFSTIVLAASIFLFYAGMEMQAVHVPNMKNPSRTFPQAVLWAVVIILVVFIGGTLAIGFVIPSKDINLLASLLVAYNNLFASIHCEWLGNVLALFLTFGVIGQVSCVIAAPSTGMLAVGRAGYLPRKLQKTNKNDIQVPILIVQGVLVSILSLVLVVLPSVESAYQILSQMSTIIYLAMVFIIYFSFLRLRRTEPNVKRGFRVPGGEFGKWLVAGIGILGALVAMLLSFVPPSQINTGSPFVYVLILIVGSAIFIIIPFLVYAKRKANWRDPATTFEPFEWEIEGRTPDQISKWPAGYVPTEAQIKRAMEWEDGEFGPVSMKTVHEVADLAIKPSVTPTENTDPADKQKP